MNIDVSNAGIPLSNWSYALTMPMASFAHPAVMETPVDFYLLFHAAQAIRKAILSAPLPPTVPRRGASPEPVDPLQPGAVT